MQLKIEGQQDLLSKISQKESSSNELGALLDQGFEEKLEFASMLESEKSKELNSEEGLLKLLKPKEEKGETGKSLESDLTEIIKKNQLGERDEVKFEKIGKKNQVKSVQADQLQGKLDVISKEHRPLEVVKSDFSTEKLNESVEKPLNSETKELLSKLTNKNKSNSLHDVLNLKRPEEVAASKKVEVANIEAKNTEIADKVKLQNEVNKLTLQRKSTSPLDLLKQQSSEDFVNHATTIKNKTEVEEAVKPKTNHKISSYQKENKVLDNTILKPASFKDESIFSFPEKLEIDSMVETSKKLESQLNSNLSDMMKMEKAPALEAAVAKPVVDLSNVNAKNTQELIGKISNYIEQSYVANSDQLDVVVKHDDLGMFQLQAKKSGITNQAVDLKINTLNEAGQQFFVENEAELLKSLNQKGIKVLDFKLTSNKDMLVMSDQKSMSSFEKSSQDSGQQSFGERSSQQSSKEGQEDSQRRRHLWQQFAEQRAYA